MVAETAGKSAQIDRGGTPWGPTGALGRRSHIPAPYSGADLKI